MSSINIHLTGSLHITSTSISLHHIKLSIHFFQSWRRLTSGKCNLNQSARLSPSLFDLTLPTFSSSIPLWQGVPGQFNLCSYRSELHNSPLRTSQQTTSTLERSVSIQRAQWVQLGTSSKRQKYHKFPYRALSTVPGVVVSSMTSMAPWGPRPVHSFQNS